MKTLSRTWLAQIDSTMDTGLPMYSGNEADDEQAKLGAKRDSTELHRNP